MACASATARVVLPVPAPPRTRIDVVATSLVPFATSGSPGGVKMYSKFLTGNSRICVPVMRLWPPALVASAPETAVETRQRCEDALGLSWQGPGLLWQQPNPAPDSGAYSRLA